MDSETDQIHADNVSAVESATSNDIECPLNENINNSKAGYLRDNTPLLSTADDGSTDRHSIDSKYSPALAEYRYTAYQQVVIKNQAVPIVAFFAAKLKFPDTKYEGTIVNLQHGDVYNNHIFMIAVTAENQNNDIYSVFVKKDWFFRLYERLLGEGKTLSSSPMFQPGLYSLEY